MGKRDPRVDAYIARAPEYARPILTHLRAVVHEGCPDAEETLKWNSPSFMYQGILCGFAAFKAHAVFGFWKGSLILKDKNIGLGAMGSMGRLTQVSDLPPRRVLLGYVKKAMALNENGTKAPAKHRKSANPPVRTPTDLGAALKRNARAAATYRAFSTSAKREYVEWITEAKSVETRRRRLATAIEWMSDGKHRNWKYMKT